MPFYEYRCEACAHELEAMQKMSDAPLRDCPACGKPALRKLVSAAAFRLKGGGWYETDFKSDKKKNLHESGETAAKGSGESPSKESPVKADKPAPKPEQGTSAKSTG